MWCSAFHDPNFIVQSLIFLATFLAVVVALFLKEIRAVVSPLELRVELANPNGHLTDVLFRVPGGALPVKQRLGQGRYYHLKVSNSRRKIDVINNVFVSLLRVEEKGGDNEYHETWSGDVPLQWRNELEARKVVGTWCEADLCHVVEGKWLELAVEKVVPLGLQKRYRKPGTGPPDADDYADFPLDLRVTVQARGNEADSDEQRYRLYWDGKWEDGAVEMHKHCHVTRL